MRYRVVSGICRIPPDVRLRLTAEQAATRAHRLGSVEPVGDDGDVVATTLREIEFKAGEVVDLPWRSAPAYLSSVITPVALAAPKADAPATRAAAPITKPIVPVKRPA